MKIKYRKNKSKVRKFFGHTDGNRKVNNPKKYSDYIKYGYPQEMRSKKDIMYNDLEKQLEQELEQENG